MAKTQSPLLGYNTNVRHKGKVFHLQTEDSGVAKPHVITHLFADGGRIVKSVKCSYADRLDTPDLQTQVKKLMQDQHKAMFIALRDGVYDAPAEVAPDAAAEVVEGSDFAATMPIATMPIATEPIDDSIELDESSFVEEITAERPPVREPVTAPSPPTPVPVAPPFPPLAASPSATLNAAPARTGSRQSAGWSPATGRPPPPLGAAPTGPPPLRPAPTRATTTAPLGATATAPLGATATAPPQATTVDAARPEKRTPFLGTRLAPVFGERLVSERSLDEVILSYLAEELAEPSKR